jgi:DNA-binding response OmpR family regulator
MTDRTKILVVDDDPTWLRAVVRLLTAAGYDVTEAATGQAALAALHTNQPDLVLLDIMLPDADGLELCRHIKADPAHARTFVILMSASQTSSDEQSLGLETGADGYIARPISNRELVARVRALVRIREAEAERDRLFAELQQTLAEIKTLKGFIPICASCKKIRDDQGFWNQLESYITQHSDAQFSHGICPECITRLYLEESSSSLTQAD